MAREQDINTSFDRETYNMVKQLTTRHARACFTYKNEKHYRSVEFGPYQQGRRIIAREPGEGESLVVALGEGLGFKVVTDHGKKEAFYKAGDTVEIGDQTFYGK